MYSVERQALAQLVTAPDLAGDPGFAEDLRRHEAETQEQATLIGRRLEARGGSPSAIKDAIMRLGGKGFLLFARVMPETPGRLLAHCYSYEAMEWAGYQMLKGLAEEAGDEETANVAQEIGAEERRMMERIAIRYEDVERQSHAATPAPEMADHVRKHLAEAHALESQSVELMEKSRKIAGAPQLAGACDEGVQQARQHISTLERCLDTMGASPSILEDSVLAAGGYNWGLFFQAQADTPAKLAAFVYAVVHLKIAGYELLKLTAQRTGDEATANVCVILIGEEQRLAQSVASTFPGTIRATLAAVAD